MVVLNAVLESVATVATSDVPTILSWISNYGFPTVMCLVLMWYVKRINDQHKNEVNAIEERHSTEMKEITTAITNNTLVVQRLCDKLGE